MGISAKIVLFLGLLLFEMRRRWVQPERHTAVSAYVQVHCGIVKRYMGFYAV